ncbi:MAG: hypothetical protein JO270_12265 [Acidobacteriaceae bacterium]|nr:hypothetical protein [Acidobacteriaceae bacterium]
MRKYLVLRSPNILAAEIRQRTVRTKTVHVPAQNGPLPASADASVELGAPRRAHETARWNFEAGTSLARLDTDRQAHPRPVAVPREESESVTLGRCIPISRQATESALSQVDQARRAAESKAILDALNSSLWNRKRAAMLLNVDYKALLYKMKKLGIGEKKSAAMG